MPGSAELQIHSGGPGRSQAWCVGAFRGQPPAVGELPPALDAGATSLARRKGWTREDGQTAETALADGTVVHLRGLGAAEAFELRSLRTWLSAVAAVAARGGAKRIGIAIPDH